MKCPKCSYLGFDTGDRCKNCGYDFSLIPADLDLKPAPAPERRVPDLPLFAPVDGVDDEPLVKLPAAPRAPLSVRRTPDLPRQRVVSRPAEVVERPVEERRAPEEKKAPAPVVVARPQSAPAPAPVPSVASGTAARLAAAAVDVLILLAVDASILYLTLRMASLEMSDWQMLPPVPMLAFLALLKFGYVAAFTSIGGQTIGKMAAGIRVVTEDNRALDPAGALHRTLAGIVSLVPLGLGFIAALVTADRRAFHDRLAHTRVVAVRSVS